MQITMIGDYEVSRDGKTLWINGPDGCCVARFSKKGIDIHRPAIEQETMGQCLDCKAGPLTAEDWSIFRRGIFAHFNILIPPSYIPDMT